MINKSKTKKNISIRGWLILPTIGLFLSAIYGILGFVVGGLSLYLEDSGIYELMIFLSSGIIAFLAIYSLILEFKKREKFPKFVIASYWIGLILTIILSSFDNDYSNIFATTIGAIIWTWYFSVSKRVKNTFVK